MGMETVFIGIVGWAMAAGFAVGLGAAAKRGDTRRAAAMDRALTGR
jgi:hypothetical protein